MTKKANKRKLKKVEKQQADIRKRQKKTEKQIKDYCYFRYHLHNLDWTIDTIRRSKNPNKKFGAPKAELKMTVSCIQDMSDYFHDETKKLERENYALGKTLSTLWDKGWKLRGNGVSKR